MEQLRTAAPGLVNSMGLGNTVYTTPPTTAPGTGAGTGTGTTPTAQPTPNNSEAFSQV